jgi:hypothetical protein
MFTSALALELDVERYSLHKNFIFSKEGLRQGTRFS